MTSWWRLVLFGCLPLGSGAAQAQSGEDVIRMMHQRYSGGWFHTVMFAQDNTHYAGDSTWHSRWDHAFQLPGKLRIDNYPLEQGNGVIIANDTTYVFQGGKLTSTVTRPLSLMLIAFDAYVIPPEKTISDLRALGFDLGVVHEEPWQGRPAYVVGAHAGDLHARQFWIDRENLLAVRVIEPLAQDSTKARDVRFNKYERIGQGWIAPEVMMYQGGKPLRLEAYQWMRKDVPVDPRLFDPAQFNATRGFLKDREE